MTPPVEDTPSRTGRLRAPRLSAGQATRTTETRMRARDLSGPTSLKPGKAAVGGGDRPQAVSRQAAGEADAAADERLVAEIGHELGNYFHKLYYWADFLREAGRPGGRRRRGRDARRHHREPRGFPQAGARVLPPGVGSPRCRPRARRGRCDDRAAAGARCVDRRRRVADAEVWSQRELSWDQGRMYSVLQAIASHLTEQAPAGTGVHVAIEGDGDGIEVVFRIEGGFGAPEFRSGVACLEWALAERIVRAHRGRLSERRSAEGSTALVLALPFDH